MIIYRYALKNAIGPTLTVIGLTLAYSLTGAFFVEIIFNWPGLGMFTARSFLNLDYPAIMGMTLFGASGYVVINLVVDLLQAWIDPRISLRVEASECRFGGCFWANAARFSSRWLMSRTGIRLRRRSWSSTLSASSGATRWRCFSICLDRAADCAGGRRARYLRPILIRARGEPTPQTRLLPPSSAVMCSARTIWGATCSAGSSTARVPR